MFIPKTFVRPSEKEEENSIIDNSSQYLGSETSTTSQINKEKKVIEIREKNDEKDDSDECYNFYRELCSNTENESTPHDESLNLKIGIESQTCKNNNNTYCTVCAVDYKGSYDEHCKSALHVLKFSFHLTNQERSEGYQRALQNDYGISRENKGYQLLLKGGWKGKGLGKHQEGEKFPIKTTLKNDRLGVGNKPLSAARITHLQPLPERPKLKDRIFPPHIFHSSSSKVENQNYYNSLVEFDIFSALEVLSPLEEEKLEATKQMRKLQIQRENLKLKLLRKELYSPS